MNITDFLPDSIKDQIKSHDYKQQREDYFNNGVEVALMKNFTRAAQNAFIDELANKIAKVAKPAVRGDIPVEEKITSYVKNVPAYYKHKETRSIVYPSDYNRFLEEFANNPEYKMQFPSWNGSELRDKTFNPDEFEEVMSRRKLSPTQFKQLKRSLKRGDKVPEDRSGRQEIDFNPDEWTPIVKKTGGKNVLLPRKQADEEAAKQLAYAIKLMPEDEQDAWLYGQRVLHDSKDPKRITGDINKFKNSRSSKYMSTSANRLPFWGENIVNIKKGQDINNFVRSVLHEGGHRTMAGPLGSDERSVVSILGRDMRNDLIDEITNSDNPGKIIRDLAGDNEAVQALLADAAVLNPNNKKLTRSSTGWGHSNSYRKIWQDEYNRNKFVLPNDIVGREAMVMHAPMSMEGAAEIYSILGTPGGYEWMQKNMPNTLKRFKEIAKRNRTIADDVFLDGAVPERFKNIK